MKIATGPNLLTTKFKKTMTTSLSSWMSLRSVAVFSSPSVFMHRPRDTARKTTASTAVLLEKVEAMFEGMTFSTTSSGLEPAEPETLSSPSTAMWNTPML